MSASLTARKKPTDQTGRRASSDAQSEPSHDCPLCERLLAFREENRAAAPDWFNAPVPSFGAKRARLLVVGLAPGLKGANRTGRPFTGDYAGDLLYETLLDFGFAKGTYGRDPQDGLSLVDCQITNAVRCVPPENKPTPAEIKTCRPFLEATLGAAPQLGAIVVLGRIAHDSTVTTLGLKKSAVPFGHGREHPVADAKQPGLTLFDSYHCSRYNTNTGVLTTQMFRDVFARVRQHLDALPA